MHITVYNDTVGSLNFGCKLVSQSLRDLISKYYPSATVEYIPMHSKENGNPKTDLVIINGEGSFGRIDKKLPDGFNLLSKVTKHHKNTAIHLVNTTIQCKRDDLTKVLPLLKQCSSITLREPLSYEFLKKNTDLKNIKVFPDLGTYVFKDYFPTEKDIDIVFGFGALYKKLSKSKHLPKIREYVEVFNELAAEGYKVVAQDFPGNPKGDLDILKKYTSKDIVEQKGTYVDYFKTVQRAKLNVTGRHHGAVMSFIGRTPFYTFNSNMWKTEGDQLLYGPFNQFEFEDFEKEELKSNIVNELKKYNKYREQIDLNFKELNSLFDGHIKHIIDSELQGI